jgi:hypothetical protein
MKDTARQHWDLATWCDEHGLKPEAVAHYTAVTRLAPDKPDAWHKLGFVKHKGGGWVRPEQAAAEQTEHKAQTEANAQWEPRLAKLRVALASGSDESRAAAERDLAAVTDPRAIPAAWKVFVVKGKGEHLRRAVQLFGQIDSPAAAQPLLMLAVGANDPEIRRAAGETLARRDVRESLDSLIRLVRTPAKYSVEEKAGADGRVRRTLKIEGEDFNLNRVYTPPLPPDPTVVARRQMEVMNSPEVQAARWAAARLELAPSIDPGIAGAFNQALANPGQAPAVVAAAASRGPTAAQVNAAQSLAFQGQTDLQTVNRGQQRLAAEMSRQKQDLDEYQRALAATEMQFQRDLATIESQNTTIRQTNDRVLPLLDNMTGQKFGDDNHAWTQWWVEEQGYSYQPPERITYTERAPEYRPSYATHHACFARGTPVATLDGPKPIETLRIGDRVLSQDTRSGELIYQPVLAVFHNPPTMTMRVSFEGFDGPIVATPIHRFWKCGTGWVMTRELKPGDTLRLLGRSTRVAKVEEEKVQPVFNLEVAQTHSFFAGTHPALVHDNSLIESVTQPFDAEPAPGSLARAGEPATQP